MDKFLAFRPARRRGLILHSGVLLLFTAGSGWLFITAMAQENRGFFIVNLLGCIAVFLPIPLILYRLFSLLRANYVIDRDGFHIQWGLRTEDIPMDEIDWIRKVEEMPYEVPLPRFSVPGAILGIQKSEELGTLEYLASDSLNLILIACHKKVLVVSPNNMDGFQLAFKRYAEMGSIAPIQSRSSNAEFLMTTLFKDKYARIFILGGLFLSLGLLIAVSFIIPGQSSIRLGFNPASDTIETAPSERLLLLPVASLFMVAADIGLGSYLYRKQGFRMASYFTFASSLILPLSFLLLVLIYIL